ncbi:MAG: ATP-binding protein [Candidatus Margulisbacteria bacterium]|nr:ATP-binding protein [Candidatus Margulisiibacteriota bacterium]
MLEQNERNLLVGDIRDKFFWGIRIRYVLVILGLALLFYAWVWNLDGGLSLWLILFVGAYNLLAHLIYSGKKHFELWQITSISSLFLLFDILAVTFLIYITGWVESPYWFLYLVLIIVSGFGLFSYFSFTVFVIAFFSAIFYLSLLLLAYTGAIPVYAPGFTLSPQELLRSIFNKAVFTTISFFLFAATIYYFSKLLNQHRAELSKKNRQLLEAMEELKSVSQMKDEFVSTASHELRTPLSVIRENISLIIDGIVGEINEKQNKLLLSSQSSLDRLTSIIENLLDLSKIQSRSLVVRRQRVDMCELVRKAAGFLKSKADEKNITIDCYQPEQVEAWADYDLMLRVFTNLIDNAIKYSHPNGQVRVGVEVEGTQVKCFVSDDGIGIAENDMPKVFARFTMIGDKNEAKGAGLGLSITKGVVEMQGGRMWVESKLGKGSKFIFTIPKGEVNER